LRALDRRLVRLGGDRHILAARRLLGRLGHAVLHVLGQEPVDEDACRVGMRPVLEEEERAAADRFEIVVGRVEGGGGPLEFSAARNFALRPGAGALG
jgi:hypothetical protein